MKHWYVVHTKPQKESNVHQLLAQGGFEAFLPKIKSFFRSRKSGQEFDDRIKPLFPSYLFIRLGTEPENFRMVKYTRGVNKIIGSPAGPIPVDDTLIEVIQGRVGPAGYVEQGALLKTQDRVVVKRGVLKDLMGILEKPVDDKGRVEVLFKIVRHQMRAKIYCGDLEKIS